MPDSLEQLAMINARLAEHIPLLTAGPDCSTIAASFEEVTRLLAQARALTASAHFDREKAREVLAEYRQRLIALRNALGRLEPLLTERRAQLRKELDHIRNTSAWASSVREQAEAKLATR
ncbi:MAG TPA: hypothetical protein VE994_18890 [Terriglobales bacterium]|nr:hypothetical protein [Terriglobales bacterium]